MDSASTLDVAPFLAEPDSGDGGIHALLALLTFLGRKLDYPTLKAITGDGYKFVYDRAHVYEPMRDLTPCDFVRDGLAFYNIEGSWRTGHSVDELAPDVARSIEAGWPVLTTHLLDASGYQLIVGFQAEPARVAVQVGGHLEGDQPAKAVRWRALDTDWDGPLSGRARWDLNPVFLIEDVGSARAPKLSDVLARGVEAGLKAYEVYEIPYGTSGYDEAFADEPLAGRVAGHASEAWATLVDEVADRPPLQENFAFVWKVTAAARRLAHDRAALAEFFEGHAGRAKGGEAEALQGLAELLSSIAAGARTLDGLVWNGSTAQADTPEDYQQLLATSRSLAYPVPQRRGFPDRLREMGYGDRMHDTQWGEAILMGDAVRWREVAAQIDRLADLDAEVESRLRRLGGD